MQETHLNVLVLSCELADILLLMVVASWHVQRSCRITGWTFSGVHWRGWHDKHRTEHQNGLNTSPNWRKHKFTTPVEHMPTTLSRSTLIMQHNTEHSNCLSIQAPWGKKKAAQRVLEWLLRRSTVPKLHVLHAAWKLCYTVTLHCSASSTVQRQQLETNLSSWTGFCCRE